MKSNYSFFMCLALASLFILGTLFSASAGTLQIVHAPITLAAQGQDILFRAQVKPGTQPIKAVTLFYAVSRDAAPYKVSMQNSGSGWFTGSISADMTTGLKQLLYYIEARDEADATAETPWYTIVVKNSGSPAVTTRPAQDDKGSSWTKPALIAGGIVLAGGAAIALASGGGGGSSGTADSTITNVAGTYIGTVTQCTEPPGGSSYCTSHAMTILIDANNVVSSDTLATGKHLEGRLSGANFLLITSVTETNGTGEIQYLGTVVNNRIAGSVQGTLTTTAGTGTYSGNFTAAK